MPKPFGEQMKEARRRKGLTQEDLAKQMSVSRSTVSHWEIGRKVPEKEFVDRLIQLLEEDFSFDQEEEAEGFHEEAIVSREVTSAEVNPSVIRKLWTAIRQVDTKNKPRRRIARHYAALLRISNGVRPFFISMRW